jgi:Xaa-Pro dipeptidase
MDLERVQQALVSEKLDGWLFYDFRKSNPVAYQVLALPPNDFYSRRWFYFVPAQGSPTAIISAVESHVLRSLPGQRHIFRSWQEMCAYLNEVLLPGLHIAMEYSPMNAIPYMSRVDAGTVELVRSFGVEVVSSANIAQRFVAQLSDDQIESQREAGRRLITAKDHLFAELGAALRAGRTPDEYSVQQRFIALLQESGIVVPNPPDIAVNANASNPHYAPSPQQSSPIVPGDLILFDFWGKLPQPDVIIADFTWMAFAGTRDEIPADRRAVFEIVRRARDAAIDFVRGRLRNGQLVQGREVDDVARNLIAREGYGDYFVHRTGHSIATAVHANGANLDNLETQDERFLLPNTCCSVEPGIYLHDFGIRSEVDLLVFEHDVEVSGVPMQQEIIPLL